MPTVIPKKVKVAEGVGLLLCGILVLALTLNCMNIAFLETARASTTRVMAAIVMVVFPVLYGMLGSRVMLRWKPVGYVDDR